MPDPERRFRRQVEMVGPDGKPVVDELVYVFAGDSQNLSLTTDAKGTAAFSFDTALWTGTITLLVGRRRHPLLPARRRPIHP